MESTDRIARLVGVITLPVDVTGLVTQVEALTAEHGKDIVVRSDLSRMLVYTPGVVCGCVKCVTADHAFLVAHGHEPGFFGMIVCPDCGSKRCVRAADHDARCARAA